MICLHLYDSLFRSSLPFTPPLPAPHMNASWLQNTCARLSRNEQVFSERMAARSSFAARVNGLLRGAHLYDAAAMDAAMAHFERANAELEARPLPSEEESPCLKETAAIREHVAQSAAPLIEGCPGLREDQQASAMICASGYTVFEAVLIHRLGDRLFDFHMHGELLRDFFLNPRFPLNAEEAVQRIPYRNIVDFKTCLSGHAELMDHVLTRFCGREYIFSNMVTLVEYYLDLMGCCYTAAYRELFSKADAALWQGMDDYAALFDFHFMNFLANIEHMHCAISSFLNRDTMDALATMAGQFNVLHGHQQRRDARRARREEFAHLLEKEWLRHTECQDHVDFTAFVLNSRLGKLVALRTLFGLKETRALVVEVLKTHNAVRGMPGFHKRRKGFVRTLSH